MNITEILSLGDNITISVKPQDLREFAVSLIKEIREQAAEEQRKQQQDRELTAQQAAKYLQVSTNTLWRWERDKYLVPHHRVGKRPIYKLSQLKSIGG